VTEVTTKTHTYRVLKKMKGVEDYFSKGMEGAAQPSLPSLPPPNRIEDVEHARNRRFRRCAQAA
jgi:hypothetical protein